MIYTAPVYITAAKRSPIGRLGGGLQTLSATDLALPVAESLLPDELKPAIQQVILGQVLQAGSGMNVARQLSLRLGLPQATPAYMVNMVCGSGMKAVALAADAIANGESTLALAGGVESMSQAPHYASALRTGCKLGHSSLVDAILADGLTDPVLNIGMGETAERIVDSCGISRADQDAFALRSQQLTSENRTAFHREIVPIQIRDALIEHDEHPRADTTLEKLAKLKPAFRKEGSVTAGNSSGVNDGSALLLLASAAAIDTHHLTARARIIGTSAVGCDPATMGLGPVNAIRRLCEETGWNLTDVDAVEINEAFAAQALACARQLGLAPTRLNQRGGAIALGHPVGCSGARILVTLLHLMEDLDLHRGIASLCIGGGMGIAMAIER
jgi:acetyl-CoA C-acetyltransferase